jgi:diguanylate cyclase (GGDEF)-like protein/PAS domain S-box-containing protein
MECLTSAVPPGKRTIVKIKNRLLFSFLSVAATVVIIGFVALDNISIIKNTYYAASQDTLPRLLKLENLRYYGTRIVYSTARLALLHYGNRHGDLQSSTDWQNELTELQESAIKPLQLSLTTYATLIDRSSQDDKLYLSATRETAEFLIISSGKVIELLKDKSTADDLMEALNILENGDHAFEAAVDAQLLYTKMELANDDEAVKRTIHNALNILVISGVMTLIFAVILGLVIAHSLAAPILQLVTSATEFGRGRFDIRAPESGSDEIKRLARGFNRMADNLAITTVSKAQMNNILRAVPDAIMLIDVGRRIEWVNATALALFEYREQDLIGHHIDEFISDSELFASIFDSLNSAPYVQGVETTFQKKGGDTLPVSISSSPYSDHTQCGGLVLVIQDSTERKKMENHLRHLANFDALTNLPNRSLLLDRIDQALAQAPRHKQQVAILFCDLDGFKLINDSYGHNIGDHTLKIAAQRLTTCVRAGDTVARHGGDEFVVILNELGNAHAACLVAQKIIDALAAPFEIHDQQYFIGISIGISIFPDDGQDATSLLNNADVAMYRVKEQGRNGYQLYAPTIVKSA